jgi:hypothetical protein
MEKIVENGVPFVSKELSRLNSILSSNKVSDKKKDEVRKKLSIIHHFDYEINFEKNDVDSEVSNEL